MIHHPDQPDQRSSKRRWARRLAAGAAVVTLAAVSLTPHTAKAQTPKASVVELTAETWVPNMNTSVDLFNKTHPGIHVNWRKVVAGGLGTYANFSNAIKANSTPDIGQIEYQFLPTFEAQNGLLDLAPYGAAAYKNDFVPWTWSQSTLGNQIFAIPQDTGPEGMYYRADLFKKYNIAVPTTWAQYAAAALKLHKANKNLYITDFAPKDPGWFIGMMWQHGAHPFGISGQSWKIALNDANGKAVAQYWQTLLDQKLVKTDPDFSDPWNRDLQTGAAATWISAVWGANTIPASAPKTSGDWRAAPMPLWDKNTVSYGNWGGSTTVVFKDSKHPKEAAEFAEWLNTNTQSVQLMIDPVKGTALYPALKSVLDSSSVNQPVAFYGNQVVNKVFGQASQHVNLSFQWGPTMDQVFTDMGDQFSNAVNGKTTLPAAMDALQASTVSHMKKLGFSVTQ